MAAVKCPDAESALVQALTAARQQSGSHRLYEALFGRYAAAGEGWWYLLKFVVEVGTNADVVDEADDARFSKIVRSWRDDVAKYEQEPAQ